MTLDPIELASVASTLALPLSLWTDGEEAPSRTTRALAWAIPVMALAATREALNGLPGLVCAGIYIALAVAVGLSRLRRAVERTTVDTTELGVALVWIYAAGGGVWLAVYAAGGQLLGFQGSWLLLTVAHFNAAGFGATTVTCLVVRACGRGHWLLALHPVAYLTVALGLSGLHLLERVGTVFYVVLFVAQLVIAARILTASFIAPKARPWSRGKASLVLVALAVPVVTLGLAADWALGGRHLDLLGMAWFHGLVNVVGHVVLGLVAFAWLSPAPRSRRLRAPLSNAVARGRLGPAFVDGLRARAPEPVTGLVPRFDAFGRDGFDPVTVSPLIAQFYEHTADFDIEATQRWHRGFVLGGKLFAAMARRVGQLGLPAEGTPAGAMTNELFDVDDARDGRTRVRAWVRTWKVTGHTLYVALYSEHERDGVRYMNIAFPLPYASLISLLCFEPLDNRGIALTSLPRPGHAGDQGVYLRFFGRVTARTPIDETIEVRAEGDRLVAHHDMWLFGRPFLRLDYVMRPSPRGRSDTVQVR